jgi:ribosome-associated protein
MRRGRSGPEPFEDGEEPLSKSAAKREAHAAQALGEELIRLPDAQLAKLELPEKLMDAILEARRITSRGGGHRQRQYIGKLMRDIDLSRIEAVLAERSEQAAREAELFKRIEAWRERLIEDPLALAELARWRPGLDQEALAPKVAAARRERADTGQVGNAGRELFRALRVLFATMPQ